MAVNEAIILKCFIDEALILKGFIDEAIKLKGFVDEAKTPLSLVRESLMKRRDSLRDSTCR
jgi:hypothetical protein